MDEKFNKQNVIDFKIIKWSKFMKNIIITSAGDGAGKSIATILKNKFTS